MRGNFLQMLLKLGKKNHGKGVKVELANEDIIVDLYVVMYFGVAIQLLHKRFKTTFAKRSLDRAGKSECSHRWRNIRKKKQKSNQCKNEKVHLVT